MSATVFEIRKSPKRPLSQFEQERSVADNKSPEGSARNRRVEISKLNCTIVAVVLNIVARAEFSMFGVTFTTGPVGVALAVMGLVTTVFTIRAVLKNQRELAELPEA